MEEEDLEVFDAIGEEGGLERYDEPLDDDLAADTVSYQVHTLCCEFPLPLVFWTWKNVLFGMNHFFPELMRTPWL